MPAGLNVFAETDWQDETGESQAKAVKWLWDQRHLKADLEARAARNFAFYKGRQFLEWHPFYHEMRWPEHLPRPNTREASELVCVNVTKYLLDQIHAQYARYEPIWSVPSMTRDEYDQSVSRFSSDLMGHYAQHEMNIPEKNDRLQVMLSTSPLSFVEVYWDPTAGEMLPPVQLDDFYRPQQEIPPGTGPEFAAEIQAENERQRQEDVEQFQGLLGFRDNKVYHYAGDERVELRDIDEVMWYPFRAKNKDQVRAYLVSTEMLPEEIVHRYNIPIESVMQASNTTDVQDRRLRMRGNFASPYMNEPVPADEFDSSILVHQLHVHKFIAPPNGATVLVIGDSNRAIRWGELGNALKVLPLIPAVDSPGKNTLWGTCPMDDAIGPQMQINDAATKENQLRRRRMNSKLVKRADKKGGDIRAFENDDPVVEVGGPLNEYMPAFIKQPIDGLDSMEIIDFNIKILQDILGIPDVELGRTDDTNAESGKAIRGLKAGSRERRAPRGKLLDRLWAEVGTIGLSDLQKFAKEQRVTGIVGDDDSIAFETWDAARLQPSIYDRFPNQAANVIVKAFSTLPTTPEEQQEWTFKLLKSGAIPPEDQGRIIADVFGYQEFKQIIDRNRAGRDRAVDNIERWKRGESVPLPFAEQNHPAFINVYEDWINTDTFTTLAMQQQELGAEVRHHIQRHKQLDAYVAEYDQIQALASRMKAMLDVSQELRADGLSNVSQVLMQAVGASVLSGGGNASPANTDKPQRNERRPAERRAPQGNNGNGRIDGRETEPGDRRQAVGAF